MLIEKTMDLAQLRERMGDDATSMEAAMMREMLILCGFELFDTASIDPMWWDAILLNACCVAAVRERVTTDGLKRGT